MDYRATYRRSEIAIPALLVIAVSIFFVISLAFAGTAVLMIFDGEIVDGRRTGEGTAIALLLPLGAGWRLRKSLRRWREKLVPGGLSDWDCGLGIHRLFRRSAELAVGSTA